MRVIRFLLKGLAVLIGLAVLGLIGFYIYLSTRPTPKTIKAAGIIAVPAASRSPLQFIDYMFVNGSKLYAGYTSQGVVAVIDTATNQVVAEIGGLPRSHGIAVAGDRGFATASGDLVDDRLRRPCGSGSRAVQADPDVVDHNARPLSGEGKRMRPTDAPPGTRHHDHAAVDQSHPFTPYLFAFEAARYGGGSPPPCTAIVVPLIYDAASDARKAAAQPISVGFASRPSGTVAATAACDSASP